MVANPAPGTPATPPAKPDRTWWIAGGIAGGVLALGIVIVVVIVLVARATGNSYTYLDSLCQDVDVSPVAEQFPVSGTDHGGGGSGRVGTTVCEYELDTRERVSDLRITAEVGPHRARARESYELSVERSSSDDPGVHDAFATVEQAAGPWQEGMIFVGDVFAASDYTVRLLALDSNLSLHITLIMSGPDAPTSYEADGAVPLAVRQTAENTVAALSR